MADGRSSAADATDLPDAHTPPSGHDDVISLTHGTAETILSEALHILSSQQGGLEASEEMQAIMKEWCQKQRPSVRIVVTPEGGPAQRGTACAACQTDPSPPSESRAPSPSPSPPQPTVRRPICASMVGSADDSHELSVVKALLMLKNLQPRGAPDGGGGDGSSGPTKPHGPVVAASGGGRSGGGVGLVKELITLQQKVKMLQESYRLLRADVLYLNFEMECVQQQVHEYQWQQNRLNKLAKVLN
ncbi:unnamed protein product [Vitrella brassicaformis CCMP3155]|uniref:Uncharacterized protein n=1 Tax=Vitrella brassicaformis (strain CCMP3155) TaxID=1169540 RepID=A0A0G4G8E6_VITBC|nr:unnamed protein product [Vitrella brassicaformis CCMP3155]|eukprot:CEM25105.1 unnamed protein product [Vitrella brassicaformis CCMP3155]